MKKLYTLILFIIIIFIGCTSSLLVNKYAEKVSPDQVDYYKDEYSSAVSNEPMFGYFGIIYGKSLTSVVDASITVIDIADSSEDFIENVEMTERILTNILNTNIQLWSQAIDQNINANGISYEHALLIIKKEYTRAGLYNSLETEKSLLEKQISELDSSKYLHTHKVFELLSQMFDLANDPKGSLGVFNQITYELTLELVKEKSLAKIELTNNTF